MAARRAASRAAACPGGPAARAPNVDDDPHAGADAEFGVNEECCGNTGAWRPVRIRTPAALAAAAISAPAGDAVGRAASRLIRRHRQNRSVFASVAQCASALARAASDAASQRPRA